jgi:type II secretory pathway component GspD/PulD (secretin)
LFGEDAGSKKDDWLAHVNAQLERNVSFDFTNTPLKDVAAFLATMTDTTVILDPKVATGNEPVTLNVKDMQVWRALKWIVRLVNLEYSVENGAIFLSTKKRILEGAIKTPKLSGTKVKEKFERKVSVEFADTALENVMAFLGGLADMNVLVQPDVEPKQLKIDLKAKEMKMADVFGWLMRMYDLTYKVEGDNAIYVSKREAAKE